MIKVLPCRSTTAPKTLSIPRSLQLARPSDREFGLKKRLQELEDENKLLKLELQKVKKLYEKNQVKTENEPKLKKAIKKQINCPECEAPVKLTDLPHGTLLLCSAACGFREVKKK